MEELKRVLVEIVRSRGSQMPRERPTSGNELRKLRESWLL